MNFTADFRVVAKSSNTNAFGLFQYVVVSRNGTAFKVHRTLCYPWKVGQVIQVPVHGERVAWEQVAVEMPSLLPSPNAVALKQIWDEKTWQVA